MMMRKLKAEVSAKINLSLNIKGVRHNMHELDSVMASVSLTDAITVCERLDDKINIYFDAPYAIPKDNTVFKAVDVLRKQFGNFGADICVQKTLPLAGGLGGSSADAAGVMVLLDYLYGFAFRGLNGRLTALKVGSDVPFMLEGGYARVCGLGEDVQPFKSSLALYTVLCNGVEGVNTAECYKMFDRLYPEKIYEPSDNRRLVQYLEDGDLKGMMGQIENALIAPSMQLNPSIQISLNALNECGAQKSFMSGSGSCCVGIFSDLDACERAKQNLLQKGLWASVAVTQSEGIKVL